MRAGARDGHEPRVTVVPYPSMELFVSCRSNVGVHRQDAIRRVALEYGFIANFSLSNVKAETTRMVEEDIARCAVFLQVWTLERGEDHAGSPWLHFEYGIATSKQIPRLRMVDTAVREKPWWEDQIPVARDHALLEFDSGAGDAHFERQVSDGIAQLLREHLLRSGR